MFHPHTPATVSAGKIHPPFRQSFLSQIPFGVLSLRVRFADSQCENPHSGEFTQ
jgi:hypothetical protein